MPWSAWDQAESSSRFRFLFSHDLRANASRVCRDGKPLHAFPDHALGHEGRTMRNLTVYNRFATIIAVLTIVFVAALVAQVMILRDTVIEERRTKVFDMVEAAKKVLASYEEKAKAGKISP